MYTEDQLLSISALQHLLFCVRQCALIHLEQAWAENRLTAEGRSLHDRVHDGGSETRRDLRIARGLRLRSLQFGLTGQADVVEFQRAESATDAAGSTVAVRLPGVAGWWQPFPVEYKRGHPKSDGSDQVQLCAQALCLEEMLSVSIPAGALFYGESRRRQEVVFDDTLRTLMAGTARRLHELVESGMTPVATYVPEKCDRCSLLELCQPKVTGGRRKIALYLASIRQENP